MKYELEIKPSCLKQIKKLCKKNKILKEILKKKIEEIILNPDRYKALRHDFATERRVHILKSFVLRYQVDEEKKTVCLLFFGHHDEAYER